MRNESPPDPDVSAAQVLSTCQLFQDVYAILRDRACVLMSAERLNHTLSATALVNEAYIRIRGSGGSECWDSHAHFVCSVSNAMRRILIDRARARLTQKRSFERACSGPEGVAGTSSELDEMLVELDEALEGLERVDPQASQLVKLRVFAGLSVIEAGEILGLKRWSAYQAWDFAQSWLQVHAESHLPQ